MTVYSILNLVWGLVGASLLIGFSASCRKRNPEHLLTVFLVALLLFPVISASDDAIRLEAFRSPQSSGQKAPDSFGKDASTRQLARMFETLESVRLTAVPITAIVLCFVEMVTLASVALIRRHQVRSSGRSPPTAPVCA